VEGVECFGVVCVREERLVDFVDLGSGKRREKAGAGMPNSHQRKIRGMAGSSGPLTDAYRRGIPCLTPAPQFKKHSFRILGRRQGIHELPRPILIPLFRPTESLLSNVRRLQGPLEENPSLSDLPGPTTTTSPTNPEDSVQVSSRLTQSSLYDHTGDLHVLASFGFQPRIELLGWTGSPTPYELSVLHCGLSSLARSVLLYILSYKVIDSNNKVREQ
jgi:hypothetical protein